MVGRGARGIEWWAWSGKVGRGGGQGPWGDGRLVRSFSTADSAQARGSGCWSCAHRVTVPRHPGLGEF